MKKFFVLLCAVMLVMGFALSASAANYYKYADFTGSDGFLGGYDVDAYSVSDTEGLLYVNRNGTQVDVYTVTLHDTDGDGDIEADQHPDNVGADGQPGVAGVDDEGDGTIDNASENNWPGSDDFVGPMESRTLELVTTYTIPAIGNRSTSEIYAAADRIYFANDNEGISEYIFSSGDVNTVVSTTLPGGGGTHGYGISHLGRASDGTWFAANEDRNVYSYNGTSWDLEFTWPSMAGGHGDGMEVFAVEVAPGVYEDHVFVSDMTSAHIAEWSNSSGTWTEIERYDYAGLPGSLEGMGAGAFGHIWATASGHLYELGGGAMPHEPNNPVPEPSTILLMGIGLLGLVGYSRKKKSCKN